MSRALISAAIVVAAVALLATPNAAAATLLFPKGGEALAGSITVTWDRVSQSSEVDLILHAGGAALTPILCNDCPGESFTFDSGKYADGNDYVLEVIEWSFSIGFRRVTTSGTFAIDNTAPVTAPTLAGATGAGGWYTGDVTAALAASDATSGVAATYASLDGGAFQAYTGSIRVTGEGSHTLRFYSVDRAGNREATGSVTFRIDSTAPASALAIGAPKVEGERVTYVRSTTGFTLTASDATSGVDRIEYRVNGGAFQTYAAPFSLVGEDGAHTLEWRAVDAAGNVETIQTALPFLDDHAPTTTATPTGPPGRAGWFLGDVTVQLAATDGTGSGVARTLLSLDGGATKEFLDGVRVTGEGAHSVRFHSVDRAGLTEETREAAIHIDSVPPSSAISIGSPRVETGRVIYVTSRTPITLSASDATSGVARIEYRLNGGEFQTYASPFTIRGQDGEHNLEWRAVDVAGNVQTLQFSRPFLDNNPPETRATLIGPPGLAGWFLGDVTVELTASDGTGSGVAKTLAALDRLSFSTYSDALRVAGDGVHTLDFHSVDHATNVEPTHRLRIGIDTTPPTSALAIGSPKVDGVRVTYLRSDTPLTLSAKDATSGVARIEYRLNGGDFEKYTGRLFVTGEDGDHKLEWRAVDVAGNVETIQFAPLFLDNTAPDLDLLRPQPGALYINDLVLAETHPLYAKAHQLAVRDADVDVATVRFAFAAGHLTADADSEDGGAGVDRVEFYVDGRLRGIGSDLGFAWTWDTRAEILGEHVLTVVTVDRLGNSRSTSLEVEVVPLSAEGVAATKDNGGPNLPQFAKEQVPPPPIPPPLPPLPTPPVPIPGVPGETPTPELPQVPGTGIGASSRLAIGPPGS